MLSPLFYDNNSMWAAALFCVLLEPRGLKKHLAYSVVQGVFFKINLWKEINKGKTSLKGLFTSSPQPG